LRICAKRFNLRAKSEETAMKAFIAAIVFSIGLAVGAAWLLDTQYQATVAEAFVGSAASVTHPGENLVGRDFARMGRKG
jgi:hypothetical protein